MANTKESNYPKIKPTKKNRRTNLTLDGKLRERAFAYSEKSGLTVTALLRNGLDLLLKQNNF